MHIIFEDRIYLGICIIIVNYNTKQKTNLFCNLYRTVTSLDLLSLFC